MKFLSFLFPSLRETARLKSDRDFWRDRCLLSEKKRETEIERNRHRERLLVDRIVESKGLNPIKDRAEKQFTESTGIDSTQPETPAQKKMKKDLQEVENVEKTAFIEDCIRQGKTKEEAEEYFAANKHQILNQT